MKNAAPAHPLRAQLEAYGLGKIPAEQASEIESHLTACSGCCQVVKNTPGDGFVAQVRAARVLRAPRTKPSPPPRRTRRPHQPPRVLAVPAATRCRRPRRLLSLCPRTWRSTRATACGP